jgi:hypothetical protein
MTIYLDPKFLKHILNLDKEATLQKAALVDKYSISIEAKNKEFTKIQSTCDEVKNLLYNLQCIVVDQDIQELYKIVNQDGVNEVDSKWKIFLKRLIRSEINDCVQRDIKVFNDYNALYFLEKTDKEIQKLKNSGVFCKDDSFTGVNLFEDYNFEQNPIYFNQISKYKTKFPATNAMIIYDQYIFGYPHKEKLENLLTYLKTHKCEQLIIPFHLTIFYTKNKRNRPVFDSPHFEKVKRSLKSIKNLSFELIEMKNPNSKDRYIITNYCYIKSGHPFIDIPEPSDYTQILDPIRNNLRNEKIVSYYNLMKKSPSSFIYQSKEGFSNRLFEGLS